MNYQTKLPDPELQEFVKCYWTLNIPAGNVLEKQRIVPDGCMEMIFHGGDLYRQYTEDGGSIIQPRCFVFGQITKILEIEDTGKTDIFSVRFHPGGFAPLVNFPLKDMENRAVPLFDLFGQRSVSLEKKILSSGSFEEKISIIETFLLNELMSPKTIDRITKSCVDIMLQLNGLIQVEDLSGQLKIHRRQLERRFSTVVGLSPKQLSKMIRIQSTLKSLAQNEFANLASVAYDNNYYDQAHFIKDFKEFTGLSPKKFYSGKLKFSSLFSAPD